LVFIFFKSLYCFSFHSKQISFLNKNILNNLCNSDVILIVRIILSPILVHELVNNFLSPKLIFELCFVWNNKFKVSFILFLFLVRLIVFIFLINRLLWSLRLLFTFIYFLITIWNEFSDFQRILGS